MEKPKIVQPCPTCKATDDPVIDYALPSLDKWLIVHASGKHCEAAVGFEPHPIGGKPGRW